MVCLFKRRKSPPSLTLKQVKNITRVLLVDDEKPTEIISHLKAEGWTIDYLRDLDAIANHKLQSAQVVCIDIMGVGAQLGEKNGMGLVARIKDSYPEKKIILYSSVAQQDIFNDALDLVDKRLRKETSLIPFSSAVEELATETLNWSDAIRHAYDKIKDSLPNDVTKEKFEKTLADSLTNKGLNHEKIEKGLKVTKEYASTIAALLKLAAAAS